MSLATPKEESIILNHVVLSGTMGKELGKKCWKQILLPKLVDSALYDLEASARQSYDPGVWVKI